MKTRIRRVKDDDQLHEKIDDYQFQGYKLQEKTERQARLRMNDFGTGGMHLLWFLLVGWWTLGIGNALYAAYAYFSNSKEVVVKIKSED